MSQNDLSIANQGFASFRSDLNSALQALGSTNSGTSAPSTTYANQLFYDTTNNILKIRNEDNDAFISLFTLDQSNDNIESLTINGALSAESLDLNGGELILDADNDTSITADTDDQIDFKVGGTDRLILDSDGKLKVTEIAHITSGNLEIGNGDEKQIFDASGATIQFQTGDSERMRILSGGGITFNGDTATANALDDYEEGTWTPFFGGSSGDPTASYGIQNGKYTKIGNKVYANFVLIASGTPSGGGGSLLIAGLPFAINATNTQPTGYLGIVNNITNNMSTSQLMLVGQSNGTNINVMNCSGTSTTGTNNLGVSTVHNSGARIDGTFIYTITA